MPKIVPGIIVFLVLLAIVACLYLAWRARSRRDAVLVPAGVPSGFSPAASVTALYVATTEKDAPLERLAIRGLAFRARAGLRVADSGVAIDVPGETPVFIPAPDLNGVETATWAIDRVVEEDGLVRVGWNLPQGRSVDSYFRIQDTADQASVIDAITGILKTPPAPTSTESENNQ